MKTYKVIQFGAGATGKFALRAILTHPRLHLVGLGVHSPQNEGRDAGAFCRLPETGVLATRDRDSLLSTEADCVAFLPWDSPAGDVLEADSHSGALFALVCALLASGKNVVASAPNSLVYPPYLGPETMARLEGACAAGNASFLYTGVSPGFMPDRLVLALTQISARIDQISVREIMNYANYGDRDMIMGLLGFGQRPERFDPSALSGSFARALGGSVAMVADAIQTNLDRIDIDVEFAMASTGFDIATGRIEAGTIAAERIRASGIRDGRTRIVAEHITRVDDQVAPDWPRFGSGQREGYQVEIHGAPSMKMELELGAFGRNPMADAGWAVGGHLANSIIGVCEAPAGVRSFMDLPLAIGVHRMTA
ncbi:MULTISPECIES: NAD(P)H-dependent amine dehydrogenase family protein [Sphingomonas]|uniref:NAD(P)H-dependent amine dehydrogenase family protein n=1 Tax=Sphingomonas TaxID=13687 RepID=UPI0007D8E7A6|nr:MULTISPECIES: hypothetical protein [Sphingomonas]OAN65882.1 hypothetical protein A7X12_14130 [Sphingomonas sp. TDK1]